MHSLSYSPVALASVLLAMAAAPATRAALYEVDPGPYVPANGNFAAWYQDTHGRVLDLCLTRTLSSRAPGTPEQPGYMCALLPEPGVFDDSQPLLFPSNFPGEAFWFTGDAAISDAASGIELTYVSALEAAFNVETPAEGDQISFARIRIRIDLTTPGSYTVTHPYGVEVFEVTAQDIADTGGDRVINMTRDLGIGAPKTYTGALAGDIGPFLRSLNGPYAELNPDTGDVEQFIGDPNLEEPVTGSPFNTNYVRLEGPGGLDLKTELFAVSGKLSRVVRPTPLRLERATYSRQRDNDELLARQDVFVQAPPPAGQASLVDTAGSPVVMTEADGTGNWYGQSGNNPSLPASVSITADNSAAIPASTATTLAAPLVDLVQIQRAEYHLATSQLVLHAGSSDQDTPPVLTAHDPDGVSIGTLGGDGPVQTLSTTFNPIPPAWIQVRSASGGSDREEVVIIP